MIQDLNSMVLARDIPEHGLARGDLGTVVFRYPEGDAFEVEFITAEGKTIVVLTLGAEDIRPLREDEILHVRALTGS